MAKKSCIALVLIPLLASAQVQEVQIKLNTRPVKISTHVFCELDGATFMVPRRIWESGEEFVLTAPNGITLGLPWQRELCRDIKDWGWRDVQSQ